MTYTAHPSHLFIPTALLIAGSITVAWSTSIAIALWIIGAVAVGWIVIAGLWDKRIEYNESLTAFARVLKDAPQPDQLYRALGIKFPELRIFAQRGGPVQYIENTELKLEWLQKFLEASDHYQFTPERLYGDGTIARKQWLIAKDLLIKRGYLLASRTANNESWLWTLNGRENAMQGYLGVEPRQLENLAEEAIA